MIYFDNAASAKPHKSAIAAFSAVVTENFCNPAALHKGGIEAEKAITAARDTILRQLPENNGGSTLIFTSGATESNNLAIINSIKSRGKTKIVTTAIEHPSVSNVIDRLCQNGEYKSVRVSPLEDIASAVCENTALVSMTAVCGETGFTIDTARIYSEIKGRFPDCIVHVDGVQGFKKVRMNADMISLSAHKTGGLPGVGGLYVKEKIRLNPMMFGGGQQKGIRPGTEPAALIAAFAEAAVVPRPLKGSSTDSGELHKKLTDGLSRLNLQINSRNSIPDIVNFSCGVKSEIMLHFLAEHGIYVSSGSACARGKKSRILPAYGINAKDIDTAIRVSFGWHNTIDEVDVFLEVLEKGIKRWAK
ncbi:MAG: aminotransferase class V-fold PLP-dependent enzyme [Oscillospiraceae bacterium]|nr:aminotransferase class V-fold PLP-dependent enzyme [Oscillospiraceae bacterium]